MGAFKDISGQKFNRLTVIKRAGIAKDGHVLWRCRCDCGSECVVFRGNLLKGNTQSCGCLNSELSAGRNRVHRGFGTRLYNIWGGMKQRCKNQNSDKYEWYGGRGIKVCNDWQKFIPFRDWALANGYTDALTIDRIDNDGNYEPENCQWITQSENSRKARLSKNGYKQCQAAA